jgi:hypothetical protein
MRTIRQQEDATWTPHGQRPDGAGRHAPQDSHDPDSPALRDAVAAPAPGRFSRWIDAARDWPAQSVQAVVGLLYPPVCAACGVSTGQAQRLCGRELLAEADLIVPVPLHRFRLWRRRFNQAAALAEVVAGIQGLPVDLTVLARVRRTRPQVGLSRNERAENLQGALRVAASARHRLEGRRVLLIDDVLTTGSTANASARALLRGGASAVDLLTFTHVIPGS